MQCRLMLFASKLASLFLQTLATLAQYGIITEEYKARRARISKTSSALGMHPHPLFNPTYPMQSYIILTTCICRESDVYWKWQKLGKQRDPEAWEMYPSQVNAYYNPPANEVCYHVIYPSTLSVLSVYVQIVFPAGILQPPFFSKDWSVAGF